MVHYYCSKEQLVYQVGLSQNADATTEAQMVQ